MAFSAKETITMVLCGAKQNVSVTRFGVWVTRWQLLV